MKDIHDLIIIGGGPGGMTAGLYAQRAGLKTKVVEAYLLGGQMNNTSDIDNYLGLQNIHGGKLSEEMSAHLFKFNGEEDIVYDKVNEIDRDKDGIFSLTLEYSEEPLYAKAVILATGCTHKTLGLPNEQEWEGRGLSYCATCDGAFFKGKNVAVIGGGNTSVEDAIYLSAIANKVSLIHRRNKLRAEAILTKRLEELDNVEILWDSVSKALVCDDDKIKGLELENVYNGEHKVISVEGVFIAIGVTPIVPKLNFSTKNVTDEGFIITNEKMETDVPGLYVIGDLREKEMRQIVTAMGDGAQATKEVSNYLNFLA